MRVLRDPAAIAQLEAGELHTLLAQRVASLSEFADYELHELVTFVVVQPGDSLEGLEEQLGFDALCNRFDGTRFGDPGFTPSWELLEQHAGYFAIVYVLSDDGFGIEVFVPKQPGVNPELLAMCATYATPAQGRSTP
jgi:hypothetical protein